MRHNSRLVTIAALTVGLLTFAAAPRVQAQAPMGATVPALPPPAVPPGMKVSCHLDAVSLAPAPNCPVLKWHGYTYWAFSYADNRLGMGIVAFNSAAAQVAKWEMPGARYVYAINVDGVGKTVSFVGQADQKITMTWDALFPPPVIVQLPPAKPPAVPAGMKVTCAGLTCPVIKWGAYTYWAFSYLDNRVGMAIVAYDAKGQVVKQWEKLGARYVNTITVDAGAKTVTLTGQSEKTLIVNWSELFPPGAAAPPVVPPGAQWVKVATPANTTFKQVSVGSAQHIWALDTGGFPWKWTGVTWQKFNGTVSTLSVASDGTVWATNPPDEMRVLKLDVANNKWTYSVPTGMKQVAALDANVAWGLDNTNSVFKLNGATWEKKGCCTSQISVGADGDLWATTPAILHWNGSNWAPSAAPGIVYVAVGSAANVWGLDAADRIYKWNGTTWEAKPGVLRNIAVASDGTVWGVQANGATLKWVP